MSDLDDLTPPSPTPPDGSGPSASRTTLGALLAVVVVAVLLALWFLVFDGDDDTSSASGGDTTTSTAAPTPLPIPTSTPTPVAAAPDEPEPTPEPTTAPTPVPEGFEACGDERAPLLTSTYIVDTVSTPLNQRAEPSVDGELLGSFDPGETGLTFNGECIVNLADGYTWWQIDNGTADVWVASIFVTPRQ